MSSALEEQNGNVNIGGKNISSQRFADSIDALLEKEQEQETVVKSLDKTCTSFKNGDEC